MTDAGDRFLTERLSPCVIGISCHSGAGTVQNCCYIALHIRHIIVGRAVVRDRRRDSVGVVSKVQCIITHCHLAQLAAVVDMLVGSAAINALCPQTFLVLPLSAFQPNVP